MTSENANTYSKWRRPDRRLARVLIFTALYMIPAIPWALSIGNREFLFYIVVMLVLITGSVASYLRGGFSISALWALSILGVLHLAGGLLPAPRSGQIEGDVRVLYNWWVIPGWLKYDHFVHAFGHAILTWIIWQTLRPRLRGERGRPTIFILVICGGTSMGFGALNEIVEFIATRLYETTNVGDYVNNSFDLVADLVGSVAGAIWIRVFWTVQARSLSATGDRGTLPPA